MKKCSVIIPTFREEDTIDTTISKLIESADDVNFEVIVVDSTPDDTTIKAINPTNDVKILKSEKGRAGQMNLGVEVSEGEVLLFLHADTIMPPGWNRIIADVIDEGYDAGGFLKQYDRSSPLLLVNSSYSNMMANLFHCLLGDNSIFVKKTVFNQIGGFEDTDIMEDVEFMRKLRNYRCKVIKDKVVTSSRRFDRFGDLKTLCVFLLVRIMYRLGADPKSIKALYYN